MVVSFGLVTPCCTTHRSACLLVKPYLKGLRQYVIVMEILIDVIPSFNINIAIIRVGGFRLTFFFLMG